MTPADLLLPVLRLGNRAITTEYDLFLQSSPALSIKTKKIQ
jgi:hypothetical protein